MNPRQAVALLALAFLIVIGQMISVRGGTSVALFAGFTAGIVLIAGSRIFGLSLENDYLPAGLAGLASMMGLGLSAAGSETRLNALVWTAPLLAALAPGGVALRAAWRGQKCQLCRRPIRRLLSFHVHAVSC